MWFEDFLKCQVQILDNIKKGYLHDLMELPNNTELCEQVLLAQPMPHCIKYAEKHQVVETDMLKLQELFKGCHDDNICSGIYARLSEGMNKVKDDNKAKMPSHPNRDKPSDRVNHRDRHN
jgi:hypothetical protein